MTDVKSLLDDKFFSKINSMGVSSVGRKHVSSTKDDLYYVTSPSDSINETSNGGEDTVYSRTAYVLPQYVENLVLGGTSSAYAFGNRSDNILAGNSGSNLLRGYGGNDRLYGLDGNDTLDGGSGSDILEGGGGNDVYRYSWGYGTDTIRDTSGSNTVRFGTEIHIDDLRLTVNRDGSWAVKIENGEEGNILTIENQNGSTPAVASFVTDYGTFSAQEFLDYQKAHFGVADGSSLPHQSVIVPGYSYPDTGSAYWNMLESIGGSRIPYVVVNPGNGNFTRTDPAYTAQIDDNIAAGMKNIAYIHISYQDRDIRAVFKSVDNYLNLYGKEKFSGFFVDEVSTNTAQDTAYMKQVYEYIKAKSADFLVIANPGTHLGRADIADYADIFVTVETGAGNYLNRYQNPTVGFETDPANSGKIWHIVYGATQDQYVQILELTQARNAGWVYVTDAKQDYYSVLPGNIEALTKAVNTGSTSALTDHSVGLSDVFGTAAADAVSASAASYSYPVSDSAAADTFGTQTQEIV